MASHRRKFPLDRVAELVPPWDTRAPYLGVLLRLAFLLNRSRSGRPLPRIRVEVRGRGITLRFPRGFLRQHPLTVADLAQEAEYLKAARFRLKAVG